jgi:acyl carrier protein
VQYSINGRSFVEVTLIEQTYKQTINQFNQLISDQSVIMSVIRSVRCVCRVAPRILTAARPVVRSNPVSRVIINQTFTRCFQTSRISLDSTVAPPPSKAEVESRVLEVIKKFDKVDAALVTLDGVELVMAFEDEFGIEISDADAEKIQSAQTAIEFISQQPNLK